jgi:hypothetical protein
MCYCDLLIVCMCWRSPCRAALSVGDGWGMLVVGFLLPGLWFSLAGQQMSDDPDLHEHTRLAGTVALSESESLAESVSSMLESESCMQRTKVGRISFMYNFLWSVWRYWITASAANTAWAITS